MHIVNRDIGGSLIAHKHCLVAGFSFPRVLSRIQIFIKKKKISAHFKQSSHGLVDVQHLIGQCLPATSGRLSNNHQLPAVLLPLSEAVLLSLPLHSASSKLMAILFSTVVYFSFNHCRDYFLLKEQ